MKRWRPRARGRGTRIRKRTSHITIVVARYEDDALEQRRQREAADTQAQRASRGRRVAASQRKAEREAAREAEHDHDHDHDDDELAVDTTDAVEADAVEVDEVGEVGEVETEATEIEAEAEAAPEAADAAEAPEDDTSEKPEGSK
jgi:large subunit ribosomal protein L22